MTNQNVASSNTIFRDLVSGLVVFLVALPLCLGVALASNAPLFSGLIAGIIGGIIIGFISGSNTSVSGPAAGLTAVVAAQIATLGSFEAFLVAVIIAGIIQVGLGIAKAGFIAKWFPSSVIKGLLAAIGVILILKQIPHVLGHDNDPEGEMSFIQSDEHNTFTEFIYLLDDFQFGAMAIGLLSVAFLMFWDRKKYLKKSPIPPSLIVVIFGILGAWIFDLIGGQLAIETTHMVQVPVAKSVNDFLGFLARPDFSSLSNPNVYLAGVIIAIVASLETLLNLEAVDKIDPQQRTSPTNRELIAQGVGNMTAGFLGGIPVTSVIVRSSVNINSGGKTKLATIIHGILLLGSVALIPALLNRIPLSALAAILLVTGFKLANPKLFKQMWKEGRSQFVPFAATVIAIVFTDLLIGIIIGLIVSIGFILQSNLRRPLRTIVEKHIGGEVLRIELANQVSFLNRGRLVEKLDSIPDGGHVLLDARNTNYIDPDILDLIQEFNEVKAPARNIKLSLIGFKDYSQIDDRILYIDYSSRDVQSQLTPEAVLEILKAGNERFRNGQQLNRDLSRQLSNTAAGQFPMAAVLSCIDSRTPAELIFDLGLGDIFSIRIAGNVAKEKVLGSIEYACAVAGAKLIVVVGHTSCGAIGAATDLYFAGKTAAETTGCTHIDALIKEIQKAFVGKIDPPTPETRQKLIDKMARKNVLRMVQTIRQSSESIEKLISDGKIAIIGAMFDINSGLVEFIDEPAKD